MKRRNLIGFGSQYGLGLLTAAVMVVLAACGSGSTSSAPPTTGAPARAQSASPATGAATTTNADDLARSMLLTVHDFPTGWSETPSTDSGSKSPVDQCEPKKPAGETGRADTGDFGQGGSASLSERVAVFSTASLARQAFSSISSTANCVVGKINAGALDNGQASFSGASFAPLSFPPVGDRSTAYRLTIHVKAKGTTGVGSEGDAYIDIVYALKGRIAFSVEGSDVLSPFDSGELQTFVTKAADKIVLP